MIAGTLSAVICTSSAAVNVSAAGLKALSGYDITGTSQVIAAETAVNSEVTHTVSLGENISADVYENGYVIIKGHGDMNDFRDSPFKALGIKRVVFENTSAEEKLVITSIGKNLFNGCDTLTECGGAELTADTLLIPDSIVSIGENAFAGCSAVKAVKLGSGVETIGRSAFENCTGLESFVVPENITSMDRCIFRGCTELKELTLPYAATAAKCADSDGDVDPNCSVADLFFDQHWNWENDAMDFSGYKLSKITVTGGDKIPSYAFSNMNCLKEVDLSGSSIADINSYAFSSCTSLTEVKLPKTLKNIGSFAFRKCSSIAEFDLPDGLETIGDNAFENCSGMSTFTIPDSVTGMGRCIFSGCTDIVELTMPYAATAAKCADADGSVDPNCSVADLFIEQHWNWENDKMDFSGYKLRKITVTGGKKVPQYAFANMSSLEEIDLSKTSTAAIDAYAFYNCTSLTTVKLPETLTAIGSYAYCATPITELPDNGSIKTVGDGAFADCKKLVITTLPASYKSIGENAFRNCTGITTFVVPATVTSMGRMLFNGCTEMTELTLPYAATAAKCAAADGSVDPNCSVADLFIDQHWNWENDKMDFSGYKLTKISITGGDVIPSYAFSNMKCLKEIDLSGSSVTDINSYAFNNCTQLEEIKLPPALKKIGGHAFCNCYSVKSFGLENGLETISGAAFENCIGLHSVTIPDTVTSMERAIFSGCLALETVVLPYAATNAESAALGGTVDPNSSVADLFIDQHWNWENDKMDFSQYAISKIVINGGKQIPRYAFANMTSLKEVEICATGISLIDENAFINCSAMVSAEIPETVADIKSGAFAGSNADIYIYGRECALSENALSDGYTGTIHGFTGSAANTYADENEFRFEPLDGETVLGPKTVSMAVGDTYTIKTGAEGAAFTSSDESVATVDGKGVITAAAPGTAVIEVIPAKGESCTITVTVRKPVIIAPPTAYTLGDVNEDGKVDAKDASAILAAYAMTSTGGESGLSEKQLKAADVNGDTKINSIDASSILAYYSFLSTTTEAVPMEKFLEENK